MSEENNLAVLKWQYEVNKQALIGYRKLMMKPVIEKFEEIINELDILRSDQ